MVSHDDVEVGITPFVELALKNGTVPDGLIVHAHSDNARVILVC